MLIKKRNILLFCLYFIFLGTGVFAQDVMLEVVADGLNLRQENKIKKTNIILELKKGDRVTLLKQGADRWYYVKTASQQEGWISSLNDSKPTVQEVSIIPQNLTQESISKKPERSFSWNLLLIGFQLFLILLCLVLMIDIIISLRKGQKLTVNQNR